MVVVSGLVIVLAWILLSRGMALVLAKSDPAAALRWHAGNPEALLRVNEIERNDAVKSARARAVLVRRPMDGRAYRQLAEVEAAAGHHQGSRALYLIAVRNSPRDRLAQAWLADDALARGALPEMIERIGLLVSMDGSLRPGLLAELARMTRHADVREALVESLVSPTSWRADYLAALAEQGSDEAEVDRFFLSLAEAGATFSPPERALWVAHLVHRRRWTAAHFAWAGGLDPLRREGTQGVFNGGFETDPAGEFDWRVSSADGSRIDMLATAGAHGNRALRVEFTGQRVDFANVEHWLLLPPGKHAFQIRVRLELRSDRGLAWRVYCLGDDTVLGSGPALRGTRAWHLSAFTFTVPEGCIAQQLRLELPARNATERMIGGVAWFDDAVIVPVAERAGGPGRARSGSMPSFPVLVAQAPEAVVMPAHPAAKPRALGPGRTLQIVSSILNSVPNAAGNHDSDVPVAP